MGKLNAFIFSYEFTDNHAKFWFKQLPEMYNLMFSFVIFLFDLHANKVYPDCYKLLFC